jgi:hypothetical protein
MRILFYLLLISTLWFIPQAAIAQNGETALTVQSGIKITAPVLSTVYIDQKEVGTTPYEAQLLPGRYTVRITADGYNPYVRKVDIANNTISQLNADLEPGEGTVEFQTNVSGSQVILDDQTLILPIRINTLPEGTHKWTIIALGHEPVSGLLTFTKGKNIFIHRELESSKGKASFITNPEGARVYLNGEELGITPLEIDDLDAGKHSVTVKKKGYSMLFRTMDTSRGNKGEVKASLSKIGASLIIKTGHKNATVYIEDTVIGSGKKVNVGRVEKGTYDIRIEAEGQKILQSHITVPSSGKVTYIATLIPEESSGVPAISRRGSNPTNVILWGGIGAGSIISATTALLFIQANQPEPAPSGDTVITLP